MTNIIPAYHQPDQDCPSPSLQKSRYPGATDAQYVQRTNGGFLPTRYIQDQDSCQGGRRGFTADFICSGPAFMGTAEFGYYTTGVYLLQ